MEQDSTKKNQVHLTWCCCDIISTQRLLLMNNRWKYRTNAWTFPLKRSFASYSVYIAMCRHIKFINSRRQNIFCGILFRTADASIMNILLDTTPYSLLSSMELPAPPPPPPPPIKIKVKCLVIGYVIVFYNLIFVLQTIRRTHLTGSEYAKN